VYPISVNESGGEFYKDSKGVSYNKGFGFRTILRRIWINIRLKPAANQLIKHLSYGKILVIGAGDGTLIRLINNKGKKNKYSIFALELSNTDYLFLKEKGINIQQSTLEDVAFPENSFDAVLATHVFEHIPNILDIFAEIRKILKPDGIFIASVPSESALSMKLGIKKNWRDLGLWGHLYSFNKINFPKLFSNYGFKLMATKETLIVPQIIAVGKNIKEITKGKPLG
jgi:SAM-dependent methyltransferase